MNDANPISRPPSVEELARSCRLGDERAYRSLVERVLPDAMALAMQFVRSREAAEDVVQEAFLRLARAFPTYDPRRAFSPWFFTIVRNCARTRAAQEHRRARNEASRRATRAGEEPTMFGTLGGMAVDLERALARLPTMQQRCVRLCWFEGYTSSEASRLLGVREGTVRTHVKRARTRLRGLLDQTGGCS